MHIDASTFDIPQEKLEHYASLKRHEVMQELMTPETINAIAQWDAYLLYGPIFKTMEEPSCPCPDYIKLCMQSQEYRDRPRQLYDRLTGHDRPEYQTERTKRLAQIWESIHEQMEREMLGKGIDEEVLEEFKQKTENQK